ncbi:MAG TPA: methionyl-tRNA formyltransferase [Gemmatimonadota bacterium]|nr:methionyl-tRNA formyltransferase [Gemmatimonadota bacterium]
MRIAFWGTPQFAHSVLAALLAAGRDVVGVITQPDRPKGRGRKLQPPPVKLLAEEHGLPVLQPERPRGEEFMAALSDMRFDISVVAAYGHILRAEVLALPPLGSFNVHASLLPKLRGAAPVNWAIIRGHEETGVTIMRMVEAMDAGPMLLQARCMIGPEETAGELTKRLAELGAASLLEALGLIETGRAQEEAQDDAQATLAPKLRPDDVRIRWEMSAVEIARWIRGADPAPAAWSQLAELRVQLFAPRVIAEQVAGDPGDVVNADPRQGLQVATGAGLLGIGEVQPAGKRRMEAADWIRGRGVSRGQRFS